MDKIPMDIRHNHIFKRCGRAITEADKHRGLAIEDQYGAHIAGLISSLSVWQRGQLRQALCIPEGEPILRHNPHTHKHLPDYEMGLFKWDVKVRSGQVWRQDAHRMMGKFHGGKGAIVSPEALDLQAVSRTEWAAAGIENLTLRGLVNHLRGLIGLEEAITSCTGMGIKGPLPITMNSLVGTKLGYTGDNEAICYAISKQRLALRYAAGHYHVLQSRPEPKGRRPRQWGSAVRMQPARFLNGKG
jgi:hypothetical protein